MRKLLIVLIVFVLSIISLILLFNTCTNTSKQSNIQTAKELPVYTNAIKRLAGALRIPTTLDSLSAVHFEQFHQTLQSYYPAIFNNPNVEWQRFEKFSLVAKWIGRTPELAPIVLVAEQWVAEPNLATIPEWSFNPFMGKIDKGFIHGQGSQSGKTALLALLEVLNDFVHKNILPNRTIYFVFPHNNQLGEKAIIQALASAQIHPEFVLKTGGLISQNMLWDIPQPTALIGIGRQTVIEATLEAKNLSKSSIQQAIEQLQTVLPFVPMEGTALNNFLSYISPEMAFGNRLVFSNQWLLSNIQQKWLQNNPLTKKLFGHNITYTITQQEDKTASLINLMVTSPYTNIDLEQWIKKHLQHPQIQLLRQPQYIYKNQKTAFGNHHAYRWISNTCKEVFPNIITAPILIHETSIVNWQNNIDANIYYFHPIVYTHQKWIKKERKVDAKISTKNYEQLIQFYYQLIKNTI